MEDKIRTECKLTEESARHKEAENKIMNRMPEYTLMNNVFVMLMAHRFPEVFPDMLNTFFDEDLGLDGKSIKIQDVYPTDGNDKEIRCDIVGSNKYGDKVVLEVENNDYFDELRLRYYESKLNRDMLKPGDDYEGIAKLRIAIVEKKGVLSNKLSRSYENKVITEKYKSFEGRKKFIDDDVDIVRINAGYYNEKDDSTLAKYIHDFNCTRAEDCKIPSLREAMSYLKRDDEREWVGKMLYSYQGMTDRILSEEEYMYAFNKGITKGREEGEVRGITKGIAEGIEKSIYMLLLNG